MFGAVRTGPVRSGHAPLATRARSSLCDGTVGDGWDTQGVFGRLMGVLRRFFFAWVGEEWIGWGCRGRWWVVGWGCAAYGPRGRKRREEVELGVWLMMGGLCVSMV